jgi:hypothetical protein
MKFIELYYQNNYLFEVKVSELMLKTDSGRVERSEDMFTKQPTVTDAGNGLVKIEYNFKANPSVEQKRHWGYILYDENNKDVKELYCDCLDHAFRQRYTFVKNDLGTWNLNPKYQKREPFVHNQEPTKITNPDEKLYVCKHLYQLLNNYLP